MESVFNLILGDFVLVNENMQVDSVNKEEEEDFIRSYANVGNVVVAASKARSQNREDKVMGDRRTEDVPVGVRWGGVRMVVRLPQRHHHHVHPHLRVYVSQDTQSTSSRRTVCPVLLVALPPSRILYSPFHSHSLAYGGSDFSCPCTRDFSLLIVGCPIPDPHMDLKAE